MPFQKIYQLLTVELQSFQQHIMSNTGDIKSKEQLYLLSKNHAGLFTNLGNKDPAAFNFVLRILALGLYCQNETIILLVIDALLAIVRAVYQFEPYPPQPQRPNSASPAGAHTTEEEAETEGDQGDIPPPLPPLREMIWNWFTDPPQTMETTSHIITFSGYAFASFFVRL